MERNYIPRLVIEDVPASSSLEYVKKRVIDFRRMYSDFDIYLTDLLKVLDSNYVDILSVLDNSFIGTHFILGKNSIFNLLVKFYNYSFSVDETCVYIKKSRYLYERILNSKIEVKNILLDCSNEFYFIVKAIDNGNSVFKDYLPLCFNATYYENIDFFGFTFDCDVENIDDGFYLFSGYLQLFDKLEEFLRVQYKDILKYSTELIPIIKNKNLSVYNIQKTCNVGFNLANKIFNQLKGI